MKIKTLTLGMLAFGASLMATPIPYDNVGVEAPEEGFITNGGNIKIFFFGSDAAFASQIEVFVNGASQGGQILPNHTSVKGVHVIDLGTFAAGLQMFFKLHVSTTGDIWDSRKVQNSDGLNHIYATPLGVDAVLNPLGAGTTATYIGFEDKKKGDADLDYDDHQFVFTNVRNTTTAIPEPGSLLMLGAGLLAVGFIGRRAKA